MMHAFGEVYDTLEGENLRSVVVSPFCNPYTVVDILCVLACLCACMFLWVFVFHILIHVSVALKTPVDILSSVCQGNGRANLKPEKILKCLRT